jgi:hypothetical protein
MRISPSAALALACLALAAPAHAQTAGKTAIKWKRSVLDTKFRGEGVAVGDVNRDGKADVLAGDVWYEAPSWKVHPIRAAKKEDYRDGDKNVYSNTFCCWTEDLNADGWVDLIVIGFPGAPCHWYENPRDKGGMWQEHFICKSACNETPQYVDLFGKGKRVLVMGYEEKQMIWLAPAAEPTQPWTMHIIGGDGKKAVAGSAKYAHGLGVGDVNGDGRRDVICTGGWYEQPAQLSDAPWSFHAVDLGPACADMYAIDVDGDGQSDIVSSSAHDYGFWVHLQRPGKDGPAFVRQPLFVPPVDLVKQPLKHQFSEDEAKVYAAFNKARQEGQKKAPLVASAELCRMARDHVERLVKSSASEVNIAGTYGKVIAVASASADKPSDTLAKELLAEADKIGLVPGHEVGVGCSKTADGKLRCTLIVGDRGKFSLPSQTHALNHVDIDGDGVKDLVTGRRWWAHGPKGDAGPNDPAFLYWFQARRDSKGTITFTPHEVDDESGVGTQFAVADVNGDGIPDIVISNKRGVFVFEQIRGGAETGPARRD